MSHIINWKRGLVILLLAETFFVTITVGIHEGIHALEFYFLSGRVGEIHLYDSVAYSYHQIAVTIPPQGLVIQDTTLLELIAYIPSFFISFCVVFILFKLFYSDSNIKKSEMPLEYYTVFLIGFFPVRSHLLFRKMIQYQHKIKIQS